MMHPALCVLVSRVSQCSSAHGTAAREEKGRQTGTFILISREMKVLTEAFERGVSVELRLGGTLVGGRQLSQVVQGVVEGRLGFGVVVFTGKQGASCCQLSIVHPRGAFYRGRGEKTTGC